MADVSVTAASVLASTGAVTHRGTAGATITAGQPVYKDATDGDKLKPGDANAAASAAIVGIALHAALDEQPLVYASEDDNFTPGFATSLSAAADKGVYVLSGTAGGIAPVGDLASTMYPVLLMTVKVAGVAGTGTAKLKITTGPSVLVA